MPPSNAAFHGLGKHAQIVEGPKRTPFTPYYKVPISQRLIQSVSSKKTAFRTEKVYPYPAEKCFENFKTDYRKVLLYMLKDNQDAATKVLGEQFYPNPEYIKNGKGDVPGAEGTLVRFASFKEGVIYHIVEHITKVDDGTEKDPNGNKVYRFGWEQPAERADPFLPLTHNRVYLIFTTFQNDKNKCHITFIREFDQPTVLGVISLADSIRDQFAADTERILFVLGMMYNIDYNPKLPKMDSKVCVIGAGPSGLHMAYELIQRGMPVKNLTILEKDTRYGGKTLSIKDESEVQISDPVFNPPIPRFSLHPEGLMNFLFYKLKSLQPMPPFGTAFYRKSLPDALQFQDKDEYYKDGEDVFHELGTCYMSPGYYAIRTLLKQVQGQVADRAKLLGSLNQDSGEWMKLAQADLTREVGPDTYAIESAAWEGAYTLDEWVFKSGLSSTKLANLFTRVPAQKFFVNSAVLVAKIKYCRLHAQYLGNYSYTMPPKPFDVVMNDLTVSFEDFLVVNKLSLLLPLFTYAMTAQGYGVLKTTPAFLAMQWLTPDLLDGYFEWYTYFSTYKDAVGEVLYPIPASLQKYDNFRKAMLVSGWGGLWDRIVKLYDFQDKMQFGVNITGIKRSARQVTVTYIKEKAEKIEVFDFLIVGAPLTDPYNEQQKQTLPLDLTALEKDIFLSKDLVASTFKTTLFKPEVNGTYEADHLRIFIDAILQPTMENAPPNNVGKGEVFGVRDSYKAIQPRLSTKNGDVFDPAREHTREKMCYQYVDPGETKKITDPVLKDKWKQFMLDHPEYLDSNKEGNKIQRINAMKIHEKGWSYYYHFENKSLADGKLWRILDFQGENNTIFVHASTNFESVLDIVNYNNMLLDGLAGRLDNMINPERDVRPQPWERPQPLLLTRSYFNQGVKFILNWILFIVWGLWYVISYPIAELTYLRFQRYSLQKAFGTPELGSPWQMDMSKFLAVSPTVRGYVDYVAGKPNGIPDPIPMDYDPYKWDAKLGPGDTVFKLTQHPKYKFNERFPGIPSYKTIPTSIYWNLADFRVGVRQWVTNYDDKFLALMPDYLLAFIQSMSYFFPNYYGWIFSWVFASQFRLLTGFAYRIENSEGGGLRIPDCHMLRVLYKDYGKTVGQKICLTVCKMFTEEAMRKKGLMVDFQPDYLSGAGTGCTVRMHQPKEHAFSNHSLQEFRTASEENKFKTIDMAW